MLLSAKLIPGAPFSYSPNRQKHARVSLITHCYRPVTFFTHGGAKNSYTTQGRDAARQEAYNNAVQAALDALDPNATNNTRNAAHQGVAIMPDINDNMIKAGLQ